MQTLTLHDAAAFLKINPVTLLEKANAGTITGANIGKRWVSVDIYLIDYIRSKYPWRVLRLVCGAARIDAGT